MSLTVLPQGILDYAAKHSTAISPLCAEILSESRREHGDLALGIAGHTVGLLLGMLIRLGNFKSIMEIGTFTGYTAVAMADYASAAATVYTCEIDPAYHRAARSNLVKFKGPSTIRLITDDVFEFLRKEPDLMFDFVFIDGNKREYEEYFRAVLPRIEPHGLICIDNSLRSGRVLDPDTEEDSAVTRMNRLIADQQDLTKLILPLRDGLTLVQKRPSVPV